MSQDVLNFEYEEGISLEYKEALWKIPDSIWESVSAFANTDGGLIILGVAEDKNDGTLSVTGVIDSSKMITDLLNTQASNKLSEKVITEDNIQVKQSGEFEIIEIYVPKAPITKRPVYLDGDYNKTYIREKDSDREVTDDELRLFLRESDTDIDGELLDFVTIDDFNLVDIKNYQALVAESQNDAEIIEQSPSDFLKEIGLAVIDRTKAERPIKFNKASLLLFGKNEAILSFFPNFFLDFIIEKDLTTGEFDDRIYTANDREHPHNIYAFFNEVRTKLNATISNKFEVNSDGTRKDSGEKLKRALREALVNVVVHADYAAREQIKIVAHKDFIIFKNPGEMRVTRQEFISGRNSVARNPKIFNVFMLAKLGEHTGIGGKNIFKSAQQLQLPTPEIETNVKSTTLTMWTLPQLEAILRDMNEEWHDTYKYIAEHLTAKFSDLESLYNSKSIGQRILREMTDANIIIRHGVKRGTYYSLPQNDPHIAKQLNNLVQNLEKQIYK